MFNYYYLSEQSQSDYKVLPRPCLVTDMHPKAGEGRQGNLEAGEGNLAEGSLAEAGKGRQTSHREGAKPA